MANVACPTSQDYLVALDFGTSSMKASLFASSGGLVSSVVMEYQIDQPHPGWQEVPPSRWWQAAVNGCKYLLEHSRIDAKRIAAVSTCALMEAAIAVDRNGEALYPGLLWTDNRNAAASQRLAELLNDPLIPSSAIPRILWIKEHEPDIFKRTHKFVQCKDYIAAQLAGYIGTDPTDAWGTGAYDIRQGRWNYDGLELVGIPRDKIPEVHPSFAVVGRVKASAATVTGLPEGAPVVAVGGDAFCAPLGAGALDSAQGYINLGTSAQVMLSIDRSKIAEVPPDTILTPSLDPTKLGLGGRVMAAGHSYNWVRQVLGQSEQEAAGKLGLDPFDLLNLAIGSAPETSPPLLCLPQFLGRNENTELGGLLLGLRLNHTRADLMRSVLEGVAMELRFNLESLQRVAGQVGEVRFVGGGAKGETWSQIIANVLGKELLVPHTVRTATSFGAALGAGIGIGLYPGVAETARLVKIARTHQPDPRSYQRYQQVYALYERVYPMITDLATALYKI